MIIPLTSFLIESFVINPENDRWYTDVVGSSLQWWWELMICEAISSDVWFETKSFVPTWRIKWSIGFLKYISCNLLCSCARKRLQLRQEKASDAPCSQNLFFFRILSRSDVLLCSLLKLYWRQLSSYLIFMSTFLFISVFVELMLTVSYFFLSRWCWISWEEYLKYFHLLLSIFIC